MSDPEEKRTCKTCAWFNDAANYCRGRDSAQAEWDTCPDHETVEEQQARMKKFFYEALTIEVDRELLKAILNVYFREQEWGAYVGELQALCKDILDRNPSLKKWKVVPPDAR